MSDSTPPPIPREPSGRTTAEGRGVGAPDPKQDATYNLLADKIGGVPNLRKKDNLYQAAGIGVGVVLGAIVGHFQDEWPQGVLLGALAGLIGGTLLSGMVLMIVGFLRK